MTHHVRKLKDATENVGTLRGAALALTGVVAALIAEATGSQAARRLVGRIEERFGIDEEEQQ